MTQTLIKNWWLLVLCGVLDAALSITYLVMQDRDGSLTFRTYALKSTIIFLGKLALTTGACSIAAGLWRSAKGKCWPLVLNGLALIALGLVFAGVFGFRISFRTIVALLVVMAVSIGILEFVTARALRSPRHVADQRFLVSAGAVSLGFALTFFALAFRWIKVQPGTHLDIVGVGSYFAFSAICMLALGLRLHRPNMLAPGSAATNPA